MRQINLDVRAQAFYQSRFSRLPRTEKKRALFSGGQDTAQFSCYHAVILRCILTSLVKLRKKRHDFRGISFEPGMERDGNDNLHP